MNLSKDNKISQNEIKKASDLLRAGKLVAIPTETVYGLAADASNPKAIAKIFELKGRPIKHPLIVHISDDSQISKWATDVPEIAYKLTKAFWPGPLTLILKRAPHVNDIVTGGQKTIGLRAPNHPITQKLLQDFKGGLAAPSANRFGHISPTCADHVLKEFGNKIELILDGGPCKIGVESTIVDLSESIPRLLRPGMISKKSIETIIGKSVLLPHQKSPQVSGTLPIHYAPNTKTKLVPSARLQQIVNTLLKHKKKVAVIARQQPRPFLGASCVNKKTQLIINNPQQPLLWITLPDDPKIFAKKLYQQMRYLDECHCDIMIIETVPKDAQWVAIKDRLQKASAKN